MLRNLWGTNLHQWIYCRKANFSVKRWTPNNKSASVVCSWTQMNRSRISAPAGDTGQNKDIVNWWVFSGALYLIIKIYKNNGLVSQREKVMMNSLIMFQRHSVAVCCSITNISTMGSMNPISRKHLSSVLSLRSFSLQRTTRDAESC